MRNAIFVSAAIHISVIGFAFSSDIRMVNQTIEEKKPMVVDYIVPAELGKPVTQKSQSDIRVAEAPSEGPPAQKTKPSERIKKEGPSRRRAAAELEKKQAGIKSTRGYAGYFKIIREMIRERLKANYRNYHGEGEVQVVFVLRADGSLAAAEGVGKPNSTVDADLADIAASSVREAAPFPRFPRALSVPQMSFNLSVSFKRAYRRA